MEYNFFTNYDSDVIEWKYYISCSVPRKKMCRNLFPPCNVIHYVPLLDFNFCALLLIVSTFIHPRSKDTQGCLITGDAWPSQELVADTTSASFKKRPRGTEVQPRILRIHKSKSSSQVPHTSAQCDKVKKGHRALLQAGKDGSYGETKSCKSETKWGTGPIKSQRMRKHQHRGGTNERKREIEPDTDSNRNRCAFSTLFGNWDAWDTLHICEPLLVSLCPFVLLSVCLLTAGWQKFKSTLTSGN